MLFLGFMFFACTCFFKHLRALPAPAWASRPRHDPCIILRDKKPGSKQTRIQQAACSLGCVSVQLSSLHPEPPVDKALHSVPLCSCMFVVQLSSPVWQGHRDHQLTSFAQEWDLCDREAGLTWVARIFVNEI